MHTLSALAAVSTTCQKTNPGAAAVGFVIFFGIVAGIVALAVANGRARSRLATANAELAFLRPENLRLNQLVASLTGSSYHEAYATPSAPSAPSAPSGPDARWYPDPSGRHQLRWWNGNEWTDSVFDGGVASNDPPVR